VSAAQGSGITYVPRTREQVAAFFGGLDMVAPGVVPVLAWRPDPNDAPEDPYAAYVYAAVGRKP